MSENKLKILIVDDESPARKKIISFLKDSSQVCSIKEAENGLVAAELIEAYKPDLIFLDIQMPGLNGFELIESIGADKMPAVIFTTAYDQYAIDAFEINAVDYLLKPFDITRFQKSFNRAVSEIEQNRNHFSLISNLLIDIHKEKKILNRILVKKAQKYFLLPIEKIFYLSSEDKYVKISSELGSFLIRETLHDLEDKLDTNIFKKINRGTLVNINFIKEIQPWTHGDFIVILFNGEILNASRNFRGNIFQQ